MHPSSTQRRRTCQGTIGATTSAAAVFKKGTAALLLFLLVLVTWTIPTTRGQEEQLITITDADLKAMTNEELEAICIQRGFELSKDEVDPETGEVYVLRHEDYVEAAQRCLAIEQDM
jgi:hypothetical protein